MVWRGKELPLRLLPPTFNPHKHKPREKKIGFSDVMYEADWEMQSEAEVLKWLKERQVIFYIDTKH